MFASLKNSRMFASSFAKRCFLSIKVLAFFYANTTTAISVNDTGYQIPVVCYSFIDSECLLAKKGGDSLSYIHSVTNKIHSHMPKDNEFVAPAKLSSRENTPYIATNVPTSFSANNNTASAIVQGENNHLTINYEFKSVFSKENLRQMLTEILKEFTEKGLITIHSNNQ